MPKILVTRVGCNGVSQWVESKESTKITASEHWGIMKKVRGLTPVVKQAGNKIFLILPKGDPCMVFEQISE